MGKGLVSPFVRNTLFIFVAVVAIACGPSDPAVKVGGDDRSKASGGADGGVNRGVPGDGKESATKGRKDTKAPEIKFPPGTFDVGKRGTGDWKEAKKSAAEIGDAVDQAFQHPVPAIGLSEVNFDVAGATLTGRTTTKIKDATTYSIEYYTPESRATLNRIIADGTAKAQLAEDGWKSMGTPVPPSGAVPPGDVLKAWPKDFMKTMFTTFESGQAVWGPLFRYWQRSGHQVVVEERQAKMKDGRPYYRIVSTAKDGTQVEVHIDGQRHLPLLVRTIVKTAEGGLDKRMWTTLWQFGGKFKDSDFLIPVKANSKTP